MTRRLFYALFLTVLVSCTDDSETTDQILTGNPKLAYKVLNLSIDSLSYKNPVALDLNNDSQVDFFLTSALLEENDLPYLYLVINRGSQHPNRILVRPAPELVNGGYWVAPLEAGALIGGTPLVNSNWNPDLSKAYFISVSDDGIKKTFAGDCVARKDKFVGLKFKIAGQYHFGWLRISHTTDEERLAILDYAYHKDPETAIVAGQK